MLESAVNISQEATHSEIAKTRVNLTLVVLLSSGCRLLEIAGLTQLQITHIRYLMTSCGEITAHIMI